MVAAPVFPTGGIIAGSGYADKELKAALIAPLVFLNEMCPTTRWGFYVDDISSSVEDADPDVAVKGLIDSGVHLRVALGDVGLSLEPQKATLVSNSPSALARIRRLYGVDKGQTLP